MIWMTRAQLAADFHEHTRGRYRRLFTRIITRRQR